MQDIHKEFIAQRNTYDKLARTVNVLLLVICIIVFPIVIIKSPDAPKYFLFLEALFIFLLYVLVKHKFVYIIKNNEVLLKKGIYKKIICLNEIYAVRLLRKKETDAFLYNCLVTKKREHSFLGKKISRLRYKRDTYVNSPHSEMFYLSIPNTSFVDDRLENFCDSTDAILIEHTKGKNLISPVALDECYELLNKLLQYKNAINSE